MHGRLSRARMMRRSPGRFMHDISGREEDCMSERILVCVAWPYAKSSTHVGQIVGAYLPADTFARYHRLAGNDVLMVSGSDEHGTPILVAADVAGESPRDTADRFSRLIREDFRVLGLSYDLFTRTTTQN